LKHTHSLSILFHTHFLLFHSNCVNSVFFRSDHVLANLRGIMVTTGTDSHLQPLAELEIWLDAVAAATSKGPVLLVGHLWRQSAE